MSDHLVRVGHLRAIQKVEGWSDSELARQCGKSPQQVYSWFSGTRQIGEKLARDLEDALNLPPYTLDDRSINSSASSPVPHSAQGQGPSVTKSIKEVPVLAWAGIHKMLDVENATLKQKAPHIETYAPVSTRAKFLQMQDDSMLGEIAPGDHMLFDPTEVPRAGDTVLVRVNSGEHFVRIFRPRTAHLFEAAPVNSAYQALSSLVDGALVVAVMVEHRRYRRPGHGS